MDAPNMTAVQRRILGSLPAWHPDEQAVVDEEGGPAVSERSHTLAEVHANLHEPGHPFLAIAGPMTQDVIQAQLQLLAAEGYCEFISESTDIAGITHDQVWRMTKEGLDALNYVSPESLESSDVPKEPAQVDLQPATSSSGSVMS